MRRRPTRSTEEEVLGGDVVVLEALRLVLGALEEGARSRIEGERPALDAGPPGRARRRAPADRGRHRPPDASKRRDRDPILVLEERGEQVLHVENRALLLGRDALRGEDGLLGPFGVTVELHGRVPASVVRRARSGARAGVGIELVDGCVDRAA